MVKSSEGSEALESSSLPHGSQLMFVGKIVVENPASISVETVDGVTKVVLVTGINRPADVEVTGDSLMWTPKKSGSGASETKEKTDEEDIFQDV